ncbi:MAG: Gfo/Idh/MocA family oxidoreductase, partial [Clostridiales bacterium]|nr:Gfo/Idh/MocA family oxidoreductase [Clostridiales bacterium]
MKNIRIGIVGLDTSHSIEFTRRMQAPDCSPEKKVEGMEVVTCYPFLTPFTNNEILAQRKAQLEEWGVKIVDSIEEAIADCDAIMIEINDPEYHLEYFKKVLSLNSNKPIFLDKPLAGTYEEGKQIYDLAKEHEVPLLSASALRYSQNLVDASNKIPQPKQAFIYGPLGVAPVGSGLIWYGVHCFEMLERAMGRGAVSVNVHKGEDSAVAVVSYSDKRQGIVALTVGDYFYGGTLRGNDKNESFVVDQSKFYTELLHDVKAFFETGKAQSEPEDALEIMDLLDCAAKSYETGKTVKLNGII